MTGKHCPASRTIVHLHTHMRFLGGGEVLYFSDENVARTKINASMEVHVATQAVTCDLHDAFKLI